MGINNSQQIDIESQVNQYREEKLPTANIIVAGITGTGKSTLINAVFGENIAKTGVGRPITDSITSYDDDNIPICIWDTVGLELDSAKTQQSIRSIRETIAKKSSGKDIYDRIHAIWYCINAGSNRYQGAELEFIHDLHSIGVPFIIVLTQCIQSEEEVNAFEQTIKRINNEKGMSDIEVVQVCAKPFHMRGFSIDAHGLENLVNVTLSKMPEFIKNGFIAAQKVDVVQKRILSEEIIMEQVEAAEKGFFDKIPIVNLVSSNSKIKNMFRKIGIVYNMVIPEESISEILKTSDVEFGKLINALVFPLFHDYNGKLTGYLQRKREQDGFKVPKEPSSGAARIIAEYGYLFVETIEEVWNDYTEEQLSKIDITVNAIMTTLNRKLKELRGRTK